MRSLGTCWLIALAFILLWVPSAMGREPPVRIIFDTDMESDCDDPAALAMLHALADRGEVEILGTMISAKHPWSAACTDAINTYFGRGDLPIGVPKQQAGIQQGSKYAEKIAARFPHDMPPFAEVPDATELYRQILAAQEDVSVTIVTVGDLTNLRYLIESEPDDNSPLSGVALVKAKVAHWVCMGSRYPADLDPGRWGNFKIDPESTVKAIAAWPTKITFTGGGKFAEMLATGESLRQLPPENPIRKAYEHYFGGIAKDRHSADQIAVLVAVRGTGYPWKLVTEGHNEIFSNGTHRWHSEPKNPNHQYISALAEGVDPSEVVAQVNELMLHSPASNR